MSLPNLSDSSLVLKNSTSCPSVYLCFVYLSQQAAIFSLYRINVLAFYARS